MSQTLRDRILAAGADPDAIAAWLETLDAKRRIEEVRALDVEAQRRLWTLCRGRAATLDDFVPPGIGAMQTVRHYGRNTLPAFKRFEKRFVRPDGEGDVLWGYNEGVTRRIVGPGYFVVRQTPGDPRGDAVIDYTAVPPRAPAGWPKVVPNTVPRQRLVYGFMQDFMRRLGAGVTIGRAFREDRETPNFFVLCRE
jgi:hypothetical protein